MIGIPKVRIETEGIRQTMMVALSRHHNNIEAVIQAELQAIDIAALVEQEVRTGIGPLVSAAVRACLEEVIQSVIGDWELRQHVRVAVTTAVVEAMLTKLKPEPEPGE